MTTLQQRQRVLITGFDGYLGSHLKHYLESHFRSLEIFGTTQHKDQSNSQFFYMPDLAQFHGVNALLKELQPHVICHMAGASHSQDEKLLFHSNVDTTKSLLEAALSLHLKPHILIPGSAAEYGVQSESSFPLHEDRVTPHPVSIYGKVKWQQTCVALEYAAQGLPVVVARIFNIIGNDLTPHSALGHFLRQILDIRQKRQAPVIHAGSLKAKRDFVDIRDIVTALWALTQHGQTGQTYNICSATPRSMKEILELLLKISQTDAQIIEEMHHHPHGDIPISYGSYEKLYCCTGWTPQYTLQQSLESMCNFKTL